MRATMRLAAMFGVLALAAAACGNGDEPALEGSPTASPATSPTGASPAPADLNLITDGTLTVCTDAPYAPFEVEDADAPSGFSGFDIDILQEIADRQGLTLSVTNTGFEPIQSGVAMNSDQCDIAAAAMTITDERAENILFSDPYFDADQSLLTKMDSGISSLEDTAGRGIGVQSNTTGAAYARDNAPDDADITDFEDPGTLFTALEAEDIDAILQDLPVNSERARTDDTVEVVETYATGEQYGFGMKLEGKQDLAAAVNQTLQEMRDDGTYDQIYDRYFEV